MSELLALLAALANAGNLVTQHLSSTSAPAGVKGKRLALYLFRQPMWLFGAVALIAGFVFQAIALHIGALSIVQPLMVAELVFALLIRRLWFHHRVSGAAWWSAVITCAGLGLFIVKQIVVAHRGAVDFHSSDADGTTFTVSLPRHKTPDEGG